MPQACLRTTRRRRIPRHRREKAGPGRGIIKNRRLIKERPSYIEERTEAGHWEGDLIIGNVSTAMATLVERMTRYTVLVKLPGSRTMDALNEALEAVFSAMAEPLVRTLTWIRAKRSLATKTSHPQPASTCSSATGPARGSGERTKTPTASSGNGGQGRRTSTHSNPSRSLAFKPRSTLGHERRSAGRHQPERSSCPCRDSALDGRPSFDDELPDASKSRRLSVGGRRNGWSGTWVRQSRDGDVRVSQQQ